MAAGHNHIQTVGNEVVDEERGRRRVIGAVTVGHDVDVRIELAEHTTNNMALTRPFLVVNSGSRLRRHCGRPVSRGIVVDVYLSLGQVRAEAADDLSDGRRLVPTGE